MIDLVTRAKPCGRALSGPPSETADIGDAPSKPPEGPTVFVVDDDPSVSAALANLLESAGYETRSFGTADAFVAAAVPDGPGCLVLDVRMPGMSGLDFQARLDELGIRLPIVFITGHGDVPMTVRAMKAGAVDFLIKPFRDDELLQAVATALESDQEGRIRHEAINRVRRLYDLLTPREAEVMGLVVRGLLNKLIAHELGVAEVTVKIHRGHAMRKMKARSVADLVRQADLLGFNGSVSTDQSSPSGGPQ